jgi:hypothetical protein
MPVAVLREICGVIVNVGAGALVVSVAVVRFTVYSPLGNTGTGNAAVTEPPTGTVPAKTVVVVNPIKNVTV